MDHIDRAIYDTVHNSEKGCSQIAKDIGISHQVLINKANPQCESHKLGLLEAMAIMRSTSNHAIYRAIGLELEIDSNPKAKPMGVLEAALLASKEHGDVIRAIHEGLEDGTLNLREKEACHREIDEAIESLRQMQQAIVQHAPHNKSLKAV